MVWEAPKSRRLKAPQPRSVRPDTDNCSKPILDACQEAGFFLDDGQVCLESIEKWEVPPGWCQPGALVTIFRCGIAPPG